MPRQPFKKQLHYSVNTAAMIAMDDPSGNYEPLLFLTHFLQRRYHASRKPNIRMNPQYELPVIQQLDPINFLQLFQTTLPCFLSLLDLVKNHSVFQNNSYHQQWDPATQLAIALCRLGSNGNGAACRRLNNLFSVGYGTIDLYTRRVIKAIKSLRTQVIQWPSQAERLELSQIMQDEGFPGCIGFVDETTIPLSQKPPIDGNHYFDRKKRWFSQFDFFMSDVYSQMLFLLPGTRLQFSLCAMQTRNSYHIMLVFLALAMICMSFNTWKSTRRHPITLTNISTYLQTQPMQVANMLFLLFVHHPWTAQIRPTSTIILHNHESELNMQLAFSRGGFQVYGK